MDVVFFCFLVHVPSIHEAKLKDMCDLIATFWGKSKVSFFARHYFRVFLIDAMPRLSSYQGVVNLLLLCWY